MRLRNKLILILGITGIVFITSFSIDTIQSSFVNLALSTITLIVLLFFLLNYFIVKRVDKLKENIAALLKSKEFKFLKMTGKDELGKMSDDITRLLIMINHLKQGSDEKLTKENHELHNKLSLLQKELLALQDKETERINSRACLTQLTRYDSITTLPNRIFFNEILNKAISHAKRRNKIMALLYINLDNFNDINTNLGTASGDVILKTIATRFTNILRAEDVVASLENDEFIILLNDINKPKFASTVAEKILKVCREPVKIANTEALISATIGICIFPDDGNSLESLFKNAEIALAKAKSAGGSRYQFYTHAMDIEAHEYIQLEGALRKAIQDNQLTLYFQPKLNLKKGSLVGIEALIRWTHPELGIISPNKFIPLAEETGLIMQIGEWALREACKTNKFWQDEGYEHLTIAVNLSPKQFYDANIVNVIESALKESGLNPSYLELEINEATVMSDMTSAIRKLDAIKALGSEISIDHFGLGYTSISHLKILPISAIKIDKNFIKGIPVKPNDLAITNAIIALAHNLGLQVIAEGVETAEQVQHLANMNCDIIQGYFLSHPLPSQKIILQFRKLMDGAII